jgi:integrase/recombinase XerD
VLSAFRRLLDLAGVRAGPGQPRPGIHSLRHTFAVATLAAPDPSRRAGRRGDALLALAVQTRLRVSEITGLRVADLHLGAGPYVRCTGKGRKDRATPLTRQTVAIMRGWLAERGGAGADPVFPGPDGKPLGTDAVRRLTQRHAATAAAHCPSLSNKKVAGRYRPPDSLLAFLEQL